MRCGSDDRHMQTTRASWRGLQCLDVVHSDAVFVARTAALVAKRTRCREVIRHALMAIDESFVRELRCEIVDEVRLCNKCRALIGTEDISS